MLIIKDEASGARRWNTWGRATKRQMGDGWKYLVEGVPIYSTL